MLSLVSIAMERYISILRMNEMESKSIWFMLTLIWAYSWILGLFPIYTGSAQYSLALQPAKLM